MVLVFVGLVLFGFVLLRRRQKRRRTGEEVKRNAELKADTQPDLQSKYEVREERMRRHELEARERRAELGNGGVKYEMDGNGKRSEMEGREEKHEMAVGKAKEL